jgi:hypothetical protein
VMLNFPIFGLRNKNFESEGSGSCLITLMKEDKWGQI